MTLTETIGRGAIERSIEDLFADPLENLETPGISVAVVDGSETVAAAGFGDRRLDPSAPATADTLWGIGSSTKPITATAVMTLVDDGTIALDDPVASFVPHFEDVPGDPITVHELLSHTSGMPADDVATVLVLESAFEDALDSSTDDHASGTVQSTRVDESPAADQPSRENGSSAADSPSHADRPSEADGPSLDDLPALDDWSSFREYVDRSLDRRLDGDHCLYYNSGYVVLARLVETVTDTPFVEYVEEAVFDPLDVGDSTFDVRVLEDDSRDAMTPYRPDEEGLQAAALPESPLFAPPGGLLTPVTDLARFLSAWIEGEVPIEDGLAETMTEPVGVFRQLVDGSEYGYGYGWMTRPFGDDVLVGHAGGTGISAGYVGFLRDRGLGVAIGCNAQPAPSPETLAIELLASITGTDVETVLPGRAIERAARTVTGEYASYRGLQRATVEWTGERLEITHRNPLGGGSVSLAPASIDPAEYVFRTTTEKGQDCTVEFTVDAADGSSEGDEVEGTTDESEDGEDGGGPADVSFVLNRIRFDRVGPLEADSGDEAEADQTG